MKTWKYIFILLAIAVPLFSLGLSNHGLWSPDEPRVAEIGREMALSGNWAVPTLNREPFLEQPPLYYVSLALAFKTFGVSDKTARVPSALFAFATVLVVFLMANFFFGPRVALFSGLILTTTGEYFRVSHWIVVDGALTFFVTSAFYSFIRAYFAEVGRRKLLWYGLFYAACTLAFYTKGFIGLVIPGLGVLVFLIIERNFKEIIRMKLWLGILIFFVMTLPWFIELWRQGGTEYFSEFFIRNHLQRFFSDNFAGILSDGAPSHHRPFYYYLTEFPSGFLPWSVLLIPVLFHVFSKSAKSDGADILSGKGIRFAKCWFFAGIIFLSAASTKRTLYLMPVFAPIGILTAVYVESTLGSLRPITKIGKVFIWVFASIILFIGLSLTPASLSVKKIYFADASVSFMGPVILLSVFVTILCCLAMRCLWKRNLKRYWISMNAAVILILLFALTVAMPVIDVHNSFVPFCRRVAAAVPAGESLHVYRPNETIRGVVPFYTGRYLLEANELSDVETMFRKEEPFYIIVRDKQERMEKKLLSTGRVFSLVKHELTGTDHALVLFSNKPAQKQLR